jgi:hypothetical protein
MSCGNRHKSICPQARVEVLPLNWHIGINWHIGTGPSLGRLLIRRLDKAQKYVPVLYERDGLTTGLFGRHSDTRTL